LVVPESVAAFAAPLHPIAPNKNAVENKTSSIRPHLLRRGRASRTRQARLVPLPATNQPGPLRRLLLNGCAGVVLTVKATVPVPVIEFAFTKQADSVKVTGMVQVRLMEEV
jgi:hypothetical protein